MPQFASFPKEIVHLIVRFFGSLDPREPSVEDVAWAHSYLLVKEKAIWLQLSAADRRHSIGVARKVLAVGDEEGLLSREHIAAALLHDCGKIVSNFGTFQRVFATVASFVVSASTVEKWGASASGLKLRFAQYRQHPMLGGELLDAAGADMFTQCWAREHHKPSDTWTVDQKIGSILKDCDDD